MQSPFPKSLSITFIEIVSKFSVYSIAAVVTLTFLAGFNPVRGHQAACDNLLTQKQAEKLFRQSALKQLEMEFGKSGLFIYKVEHALIDEFLFRIESFAKYKKPGQKELATMRLEAWVNRCSGTTIIRGNTWLADGTLIVPRYDASQLEGKGILWGRKDAPMRFIVYVDSRCPHCHRLIAYARKLVESGQVVIDLRQVSYLESTDESISDTRLFDTALIREGGSSVDLEEYLDMIGGFASEDTETKKDKFYSKAKQLVDTNTKTAFDKLHIISVPGVLIEEKEHGGQYRILGYWEMNRIFQPNL